jgi:hypothetical protein
MTSIKKLAIGLVAAVTLGLTGIAASANTQTLTVATVSASGGTTSATAIALPVVEGNVTASNALSVSVSGVAAGTTVSATATNAALLSTLTGATAASGSATLVVNASVSGSVELFVVTKTTAVGSVVVTVGNTSTTYFVKGTAGALAKVGLVAPASGLASSTQSVLVSATDQYDNAKGGSVNLVINTNGVVTTTAVTTGAGGTVSHVITLPTTGSVTVIAFAASSSAMATIAVTQPRNLQAELDTALAQLAAERVAHAVTRAQLQSVSAQAISNSQAVADLVAERAAHAVTKQNLAVEKESNDSNKAQLVSISAELTAARAKLTEVQGLTAKEVRKLKWQYNNLVKKYNVGKPKAQRLAFIK